VAGVVPVLTIAAMAGWRPWAWRVAVAGAALVAVAGIGWWLAGGRLAEAALAQALPMTLGDGLVLERLVDDPTVGPRPHLVLTATPSRARDLVAELAGRSIPPGAIRSGLTIDGRLHHPELMPELPLTLRLRADAALPSGPLVEGRLETGAVNALLARLMRQAHAAGELPLAVTPWLEPGATIDDAGDGVDKDGVVVRSFRFECRGALEMMNQVFPIDACGGRIELSFETARRGYAVAMRLHLERLEYTTPPSWPASLRPTTEQIEGVINARLAEIEGIEAPLWTPFDARVRVLLDGASGRPEAAPSGATVY